MGGAGKAVTSQVSGCSFWLIVFLTLWLHLDRGLGDGCDRVTAEEGGACPALCATA